jgi:site-specific DNA-methyltransferase (adenine-specific)
MSRLINIDKIVIDEKIWIRKNYNRDAIERYKEWYESGKTKPLIVQAGTLKLIDGFHRLQALKELGIKKVEVIEKNIPDNELRVEALKINLEHGIPLSKEERNETIKKLYLEDNLTQSEIAKIVGLSQVQVSRILEKYIMYKTNTVVVSEWLQNPKVNQEKLSKNYNITQGRVSQILNDFKQQVYDKFKKGWLKEEIIEWIRKNYNVKIDKKRLEEILLEFSDLDESIVKLDKIICDDFFKVINKINDKTIDLIYVDPPYFITEESWDQFKNEKEYWEFTRKWLELLLPKLKDTGRIYISFSQEHMFKFYELMKEFEKKFGLIFSNLIVWNYPNNIKPNNPEMYKYTWEPVFYYRKKRAGKLNLIHGAEWGGDIVSYDCWSIPQPQTNFEKDKKYHPTQKPIDLLRKIIVTGSKEGDTIFDPFAGSGTTGVACRQLNRNFILIEKNPEYVEIIKKRLEGNGHVEMD